MDLCQNCMIMRCKGVHIDNKDKVSICFGNDGEKQNNSVNDNKNQKSKQECKDAHVVDKHLVWSIGSEVAQKKQTNIQTKQTTIISFLTRLTVKVKVTAQHINADEGNIYLE